jgi:Rrf2 family nitric oxide-sensitive transcriptional repressor
MRAKDRVGLADVKINLSRSPESHGFIGTPAMRLLKWTSGVACPSNYHREPHMFSQTLEYALRIVAFIAGADGKPMTTRQIAVATHVPESYLSKVLQGLSRGGLVSSQRGLHGGSVLARPADQITLYDVAQAIDPLPRITYCPLGLKSHGTRLCAVHQRLDDAMAHVEKVFRASTIADLLTKSTGSKPLSESWDTEAVAKAEEKPVTLRVVKKKQRA